MKKRSASNIRKSVSRVHFSFVDLLFGAVAINLIFVSFYWGAILLFVSPEFVGMMYLYFDTRDGILRLLAIPAMSIPFLVIAAFFWTCWWAARGFIEIRPVPIVVATLGFALYSVLRIKYEHGIERTDGFVCAAVIVFIFLSVICKYFFARSKHV